MMEDGQPKKLKVHYKSVEGGEEFQGEYNTVCIEPARTIAPSGVSFRELF